MDSQLKDLIEMATSGGQLSKEHEALILEKAQQQNISEVEIRLYIDTALRKNSSTQKAKTISSDEWLKIKDFNVGNWITLIGSFVVMIAGFFPWIEAKVSSSGFGQSFSSGASSSVGFAYSIPFAVACFANALKINLQKYRLYNALLVIVVAIGLMVSYSSKTTAGFSGVSASASTHAGPGVGIMLLGGILYLLGTILASAKSGSTNSMKFGKLLLFIIATLILFLPINSWHSTLSYGVYSLKDLSFVVIAIVALYFYKKNETLESLNLPFNIIYLVLIIDIALRYFSFFPESNASTIISELAKDKSNFYPEIPSELNAISNSNRNWFSLPYLNSSDNTSFSFLMLLNNIALFGIKIIVSLFNLIALSKIINYIANSFELESFQAKLNNIRVSINEKVGDKFLLRGSFIAKIIQLSSLFIILFVGLKLSAAFFVNSSIHAKVKEKSKVVFDSAVARQTVIADSLSKLDAINKLEVENLTNLSSSLSQLPITESSYEDSTFIVVIALPNSYTEASEITEKLNQYSISAGNFEIPQEQSNGTTRYAAFIGTFNTRQNCILALAPIKQIYPNAKAYYKSNENNQISLIE
jgi:hypothetical protein